MIGRSPPLGGVGVVSDLGTKHRLPLGAWKAANNVRFDDNHIRPIGEPVTVAPTFNAEEATWLQVYDDDIGPRLVYGTAAGLYRLTGSGDAFEDVTRVSGPYNGGDWQSFAWGDAVVFNNGVDVPQILLPNSSNFIDLPNWGLLTSGQAAVSCRSLRPYGVYMVALDVSIDGVVKPNMVWWSSPAVIDNNDSALYAPSWDYEDPTELSGFNYVGVDEGDLIDSMSLGQSQMLYTRTGCHAMTLVGGRRIFNFRKVLDFGLANRGALVEFNNFHFVIGTASIFAHDGSTVRQIANGRVEETFFNQLKDPKDLRCMENIETKEINTLFVDKLNDYKRYLIYNYEEDNWSFADAWFGDPAVDGRFVQCMVQGLKVNPGGGTWEEQIQTWEEWTATWADLAPVVSKRAVYWMMPDQLMIAEDNPTKRCGCKRYYVSSGHLHWDDVAPEFRDTNNVSELQRILPHIEGQAETKFTIYTAQNQGSIQNLSDEVLYDPENDYKVDVRAAGRYVIMDVDITGDGSWEMYQMDYEVDQTYGR